ncbi:dihydrodipicolinate synthase family protein [Devosia sp.]|uniref:dihydrodipicolinate synthase family protein n=1 Tax=Devosia sp. TaxID=1871048 RepID=UPI002F236607
MPDIRRAPLPRGIYPMLYAYFDEHGRLDQDAAERQVEAAVAGGAHGLAVLGLGTEVNKLSAAERQALLGWVGRALAGRLPLAVTIAEADIERALAAAESAQRAGAACLIVQPPPVKGLPEDDYIRFFGAVADAAAVPVGIQNAPDFLGIGLSLDGIARLADHHPNVTMLKAEGPALYAHAVIEAVGDRLQVFNGRGGLELTDNLRAGCAGMIPAMDSADVQAAIFDLMQQGDQASEGEAERLYARILPMTVFVMQSLDSFLCYGKRITARRLGLGPVHDRAPFLAPTPTGLAWAERYAAALPAFAI